MSYSRSPISRTPLLSSAQDPGMSQRLSESSIASIANGNSQSHGMSRSGYSSVANPRAQYGPSAKLGTPSSSSQGLSTSDSSRTALGDVSSTNKLAGAGAFGMMDDDDDMDDHIHNFSAAEKRNPNAMTPFDITSARGWANALTLVFLMLALVGIFALYPILSFYTNDRNSVGANASGFNLGGVNSTGQYPDIPGLPRMIDADTPDNVKSRTGFDGEEWVLVFSDEFNQDGRTFYPGDDPFWTAVDIHYWGTNDFEWLDPSAVTTKDGHLLITMTQEPIHDLNLKSGMIQSWNQLCFNTNAYIEVSASLPGTSGVGGFWPGIWTMGNLGRPGYGATNDGTWPYTYDSCDVGTLPNQTYPDGSGPLAALNTGSDGGSLSFLPGQRLSACTCPGEDHPGPDVSKGRGAPEIDMVEAQIRISVQHGEVSQSNQIAPYDDYYQFVNTTTGSRPAVVVYDEDLTMWNTYKGGLYQQTVSGLTLLPDRIYYNQVVGGRSKEFAVFGFEYSAYPEDRDRGYIHWITDNKPAWTQYAHATPANPRTEIGPRIIAEEPMALIFNLHASNNFQNVDWAHMDFPNYMRVDYVRVYQRNDGSGTVGCDPPEYPTKDYIERHANAYNNPNLTTWDMTGNSMPKNRLSSTC